MRKLFLFLCLCLPAWATIGTSIVLDLTDRSTVARTNNVVLAGIPLAESYAITDVTKIKITTAPSGACAGGVNIDSHRLVTERWHGDPTDTSKNIKWVLVAIASPTLAGSGVAHVCLADRGVSDPDPGTATTVTTSTSASCPVSGTCYTVDTGVNKYWIRTDSFNLFDQVQRDSDSHNYVTHSTSGGIVACVGSTTIPCPAPNIFSSAVVPTATPGIPPYAILLEQPSGANTANESGANLWAQIKVSGALWNGTTPKFTYVGRLFFFGGDGMWLWKGTNIYSEDMFVTANQPTSVGLFIPTTFGASLTSTFGTVYGTESSTFPVSQANTDDVWISQYDHGNTVNSTASSIGGTASIIAGWYLCNDKNFSNLASQQDCATQNLQGFRVVKGTTTQTEGNQSDGWMGLDDGTNQANVWMRDNWQNYPMEIEANGDTIAVYQWPKHGDTLVDSRSTGDLTSIVNYKTDMALAGQTGFGHFWPWNTGAAMNLTIQSPNPGRTPFSLVSANSGQPVVFSAYGANFQSNDTPCNGAGCKFVTPCTLSAGVCTYDSTKARKIFVSGFTSGWASFNGYYSAMAVNDGSGNVATTVNGTNHWPQFAFFTTGGVAVDASTFGPLPANCATAGTGTCHFGTMDTISDANLDTTGRQWEIAGNFTSHAGATPGNDAARWRDTLLFTNPAYFCDTSLVLGHLHKQDTSTTTFNRAENEITNYFNNLYKREIVNNVYGIYYGFQLYGNPPAGFGQRYWAALGRRRYDIAYWMQFFRTADPTYFHRGQSFLRAAEVELQHPNSANPITGSLGTYSCSGTACGVDHTGTAASNVFYDSLHFKDAKGNEVVKHDGAHRCTEGAGASVWFSVYTEAFNFPGESSADVNGCSDGQSPWLDYVTSSLRLDYDIAGNPRDKDLMASVVNDEIFTASGSGTLRTIPAAPTAALDGTSTVYGGGCFGRAFGGGIQSFTDAAELLGNGTVNYISAADACFSGNIWDSPSGIRIWTSNPTGGPYDDSSIGPKDASGATGASGHTHYGSHIFTWPWSTWSFPEYVSYKGNVPVAGPSGSPVATVNVQTAMNNYANAAVGYFNTSTKSGGFYSYLFPGRIAADSQALTSDAEQLKYIRRAFEFHTDGADSVATSSGCAQTGTGALTGDTPTVPGKPGATPICSSPTATYNTNCNGNTSPCPATNLSSTINPNAISPSTPDIHDGGLLAIGLPYLEYSLNGVSPALPDYPPSFVVVPAAGANNAPLQWLTNNTGTGAITFDLALRSAVSSDFGNLSIVTPVSGDFSLTVVNPSGSNVSGVTVADSAGDTYTCSPTCVFKTPTQMWPAVAGGGSPVYNQYNANGAFLGTISCGTAPKPPSINYTAPGGVPDGLNNKDNRDFLVTIPATTVVGEYKINLTYAPCSVDPAAAGTSIGMASILSMSTGNVDLVACQNGCTADDVTVGHVNNFELVDVGSIQYINVPGAVTKLQTDSSFKHAITNSSETLYRGGTTKSGVAPNAGQWAIKQNGGWISQSTFMLTFGGVGGVKPLASPSPQTFYDSSNFSNQTFHCYTVNGGCNGAPVTLNISGCAITVTGTLHNGTTGTAYSPTVTYGVTGCGTGTPSYTVSGGSPPPGMGINSSTGVFSGTPTLANTYNYTVHVSGLAAPTPADLPQSVTINNPVVCSVNSGQNPLTSGNQGVPYIYTVGTSNCVNPLTVTISVGSLPTGLSIDNTGKISGTPTVAGTSSFTVHIVDNVGTAVDLATSITIVAAPICTITSTSPLQNGSQTAPYGPVTLTSSGCGTVTGSGWVVTVGSLPTGLTLHSTTGVIDGTPSGTGTSNFTVQFNETSATNPTKAFQITINPGCTITDSLLLSPAVQGVSYNHQVTSSNCAAPVSWTIIAGALPSGLTLGSSTGIISGTSLAAGLFTFTIQATDTNSSVGTLTNAQMSVNGPTGSDVNITINGTVR